MDGQIPPSRILKGQETISLDGRVRRGTLEAQPSPARSYACAAYSSTASSAHSCPNPSTTEGEISGARLQSMSLTISRASPCPPLRRREIPTYRLRIVLPDAFAQGVRKGKHGEGSLISIPL